MVAFSRPAKPATACCVVAASKKAALALFFYGAHGPLTGPAMLLLLAALTDQLHALSVQVEEDAFAVTVKWDKWTPKEMEFERVGNAAHWVRALPFCAWFW